MYRSVSILLACLLRFVFCDNFNEAKLRYFYGSSENYTELSLTEAHYIFGFPWYNASRTTVIYAHGFTGHPSGPAVNAVINAYLAQGQSNVVLLNWDQLAAPVQPSMANSYLNWAAPNARRLGARFSDTLLNLTAAGLNLNNTHLVGHSLGAHIFGIAGNTMFKEKGVLLRWITGLDPAGVGFEGRPQSGRLHAGSARYVAVLHSDPSKYGFSRALGTADFWPNFRNGNVRQPGCEKAGPIFSNEDLCNHNRCWQLLVDAVRYPGSVLGSYGKNFRSWKNSAKDRTKLFLEIGRYYDNITPGNYYFLTKAESPYGLGKSGL